MRTMLFLLLLLFCSKQGFSQSGWDWVRCSGGVSSDVISSVTTDPAGNVYIAGQFESSTITFGGTTLTKLGEGDAFILKYDASGNVIWAKNGGGTGYDEATSVTTDASGNVFVVGQFSGTLITFGSTTITNAGGNMFLIKYDASGNMLWAKSAGGGGSGNEYANSVTIDAMGNVFMAGYFGSTSITFDSTTLTNAGLTDIFLVKYDASGNVVWARSAGGNKNDYIGSVTTDHLGNVYVAGSFESSTITFGSTTYTNASSGGTLPRSDLFLVKYDAAGNVLWARSVGGGRDDYATSVRTDGSGNVFLAGYFYSSSLTFGSTTLTNTIWTYVAEDLFLVKYDTNGNVVWAKSAGGYGGDRATSVALDASGNIFVAGFFDGADITVGSTTLTNLGYSDLLLIKYDANGNVQWAISAGGKGDDAVTSIATDAPGNVYLAGRYFDSSISIGGTICTNAGLYDVFLAKYGSTLGLPVATEQPQTMHLYPNPTTGTITLVAPAPLSDLLVSDMLGRIVYTQTLPVKTTNILTLQLPPMPNGEYLVTATSANTTEHLQFEVKR